MTELQQKCLEAIRVGPCTLSAVIARVGERCGWWKIKEAVDELEAAGLVETFDGNHCSMVRAKGVA